MLARRSRAFPPFSPRSSLSQFVLGNGNDTSSSSFWLALLALLALFSRLQ